MKKEYIYDALVTGVVDGDTVDVIIDLGFGVNFTTRVRLFGVDTPEKNSSDIAVREVGMRATDFVRAWCLGRAVTLKSHKRDKYGRYLAELFIDGESLGEQLIENNLAVPYYGGKR